MTEQDYMAIYWDGQSMGVSALALYMTIVSGYLISSYVAGERLSSLQAGFVSSLFVVFAGFTCWGVAEYWTSAFQAAQAVKHQFVFNRMGVNPATIATPMMVLGILGSLKFSWDIRHPRSG